jgi:uncharacterized secreted repeat protein (TIGR03808 family)
MEIDRRRLLTVTAAGATAAQAVSAQAASPGVVTAIDAREFGIRPDALGPQTTALQRAIDQAARARLPLFLPPGNYRAANLTLPPFSKLIGIRGATRLEAVRGDSLLAADGAEGIELSGLVLDGKRLQMPNGRGLVHLRNVRALRLTHCDLINAGGAALSLEGVSGEVAGNHVAAAADSGIFSNDASGLAITGNVVRDCGNGGILVWRSAPGHDGTLIADNRVENIRADAGGDGPHGNASNIFSAGDVMVHGNHIRNARFSAVRGNAASNLQIVGNQCGGLGEVAIYAEFGFEGAVIANNVIDGAETGISVTTFDKGGRLAVVQGNIVRNLGGKDPTGKKGVGIAIEADSSVSGNVIEDTPAIGIAIGYGPYLRDVAVTGNIVRRAGIGVAVSVVPGAGAALIVNNVIVESRHGAILGMEWEKIATGDLARDGAGRFVQMTIANNRIR